MKEILEALRSRYAELNSRIKYLKMMVDKNLVSDELRIEHIKEIDEILNILTILIEDIDKYQKFDHK